MIISEDIEDFEVNISSLSSDYKLFYDSLKKLKGKSIFESFIVKGEEYVKKESARLERIKKTYSDFSNQFNDMCNNYVSNMIMIEEEERNQVEDLRNDFEKIKEELKENLQKFNSIVRVESDASFIYNDNTKSTIDLELIMKYPGSYLYREYLSNVRNSDGNVFIDLVGENDLLIAKYMNNDESLLNDIKKMDNEKKKRLLSDLDFLELPIKKDIMSELGCNEDNELMEIWRKRKLITVNGKSDSPLNKLLQDNFCEVIFKNQLLKNIHFSRELKTFSVNISLTYPDVIEDYLKNEQLINQELVKKYKRNGNATELIKEMEIIGINMSDHEQSIIRDCIGSKLLPDSKILESDLYDSSLKKLIGEFRWKLIYRASEHEYTASSFHAHCDNKGPTLILIKTIQGNIYGGFTTLSWNGNTCKNDSNAIVFSFSDCGRQLNESKYEVMGNMCKQIVCDPTFGPIFGDKYLSICNHCNSEESYIKPKEFFDKNDEDYGYRDDCKFCCLDFDDSDDYHFYNYGVRSQYYNTSYIGSSQRGRRASKITFRVLDYEVYNEEDYTESIKDFCHYPEIIGEYLETKKISYESLSKVDDITELLKDLRIVNCNDNDLKLEIAKYLHNPSTYLPSTTIVEAKYDIYLKRWFEGDMMLKLLYRASEHDYSAKSFHEYCDDKGPTLVVIKSTNGCVFGGYTTESWSGKDEVKYDDEAFIFSLKSPSIINPNDYKIRTDNRYSIRCDPQNGPIFGGYSPDIFISDACNKGGNFISRDKHYYFYKPIEEYSPFVNTKDPYCDNNFTVLDYEVYTYTKDIEFLKKQYKYPYAIMEYIDTENISEESIKQVDDEVKLFSEIKKFINNDNSILLKISQILLKNPSTFLPGTKIVEKEYDKYLNEWLGDSVKWKLLYRASEHEYRSDSFHKFCDDKGPTFVVIKSSGGWIFGGYTSQSWKYYITDQFHPHDKIDYKSFIFTLKNPHGLNPTRFKMRDDREYSQSKNNLSEYIHDYTSNHSDTYGPIFTDNSRNGIWINDYCNEKNTCHVLNSGYYGFMCHPEYESSLYVNTGSNEETNYFSVIDYEVYGIDYENKYTVDHICKYPEIVMEYIETKDISEESFKKINDNTELIKDMNAIDCKDESIRMKILHYIQSPSELLSGTTIVDNIYDPYLKEWLGDKYSWKLIYRASEHGYTAKSFHDCCDDKGPTLVVIKSSEGWIFGGYTTGSWNSNQTYKHSYGFIFTLKNPHGVEPTRFKQKDGVDSMICYRDSGPIFGGKKSDICIGDIKNNRLSGYISYDEIHGYKCHPIYKKSLFVNTAEPDETNCFVVLDYEVYTVDYQSVYTIDHICNDPDIMIEYLETNDISNESLNDIDDDATLLADLDSIHVDDRNIRVKISNNYNKILSEYLSETSFVEKKFDTYLRNWLGNYINWKLIYRASEHDFSADSFHKTCNDCGPTLVIIKDDKGCVYGGYTTKSWRGKNDDKNDSRAFIFKLKDKNTIEPTKYMINKKGKHAIKCNEKCGPIFGSNNCDIYVGDKCNISNVKDKSIKIRYNNFTCYEGFNDFKEIVIERHYFSRNHTILDYEVYKISNYQYYF